MTADSKRTLTLLFASMLTVMSGATISPALPAIREHFAGEPGVDLLVRLVLSMPALVIAFTAPLAGMLADRLSKPRVLLVATLIFGLAGAVGMFLDSLLALIVSRGLLGLGVAGIMITTSALVGDYFPASERGRFVGLQVSFSGIGGLIFVSGGGVLADISWRAPFGIYAVALLLVAPILMYLPRAAPASTATAQIGAAPDKVPYLAIAGLFAAGLLNSIAWYLIPTQLPFRLIEMGITKASMAGSAIGMLTLVSAAAPLLVRRLYGVLPAPAILAAGFAVMACSFLLVATAEGYVQILASMLLSGFGLGMLTPVLMVSVLGLAPAHLRGRLTGGLTSALFAGQFISPLVSQPWVARFGSAAAFRDMAFVLIVLALGLALLTFVRRARRN